MNDSIQTFGDVIHSAPRPVPEFGSSVFRLDFNSPVDGSPQWAMVEPPHHGFTWIVNIHGHGSHGDQLYTRPDIRDQWLPAFRRLGAGVLAPDLRGNAWMCPAAAIDLLALLHHVRQAWHARQFILVSGSMGGTSNVIFAALHPDQVAGVVALCPATDIGDYHRWLDTHAAGQDMRRQIADAIRAAYGGVPDRHPHRYAAHSAVRNAARLTMPLYICHGDADTLIPVGQSRALASALRTLPTFRYDELPAGNHDSPLSRCPEGLQWVMDRVPC